jgi:hypothetical protein
MTPSSEYYEEKLIEAENENARLEEELCNARERIAELEGDLRATLALLEERTMQRDVYRDALHPPVEPPEKFPWGQDPNAP